MGGMMGSTRCYLGMGGNLGHPLALFDELLDELRALPDCVGLKESPRFESEPVEATGPNYVNSVIELEWMNTAQALLAACMNLETLHGRVRSVKNAPRLIDLDVLLFGDEIIHTADLTVPHPRMHLRRFVLEPLLSLNPTVKLPGLGPASQFLTQTLDQHLVPIRV